MNLLIPFWFNIDFGKQYLIKFANSEESPGLAGV